MECIQRRAIDLSSNDRQDMGVELSGGNINLSDAWEGRNYVNDTS